MTVTTTETGTITVTGTGTVTTTETGTRTTTVTGTTVGAPDSGDASTATPAVVTGRRSARDHT